MTEENGQGSVAQGMAERKFERKAVRDERRVERRQRRRLAETLEPLLIRERIRNQWEVPELERRFLEDLDQSVRYVLIVFGVINTAACSRVWWDSQASPCSRGSPSRRRARTSACTGTASRG